MFEVFGSLYSKAGAAVEIDGIGLSHCWYHLTKPTSAGDEAASFLMTILLMGFGDIISLVYC